MFEWFWVSFVLVCVVTLVTLIGNGLWALLKWTGSSIGLWDDGREDRPCPVCGTPNNRHLKLCSECKFPLDVAASAVEA